MTSFSLIESWSWVNLTLFHSFAKSKTFLEHQRSVVLARDVSRDFFYSRWASPPINLVYLLAWPFYNSKNFKPNESASLFGIKNRKIFSYLWALVKATHSSIAMARSCACQSSCQNLLPAGKYELTGAALGAPTKDSGTSSHTPAVLRVPTPAPAPSLTPAKLVAKYTNTDLQRATKSALKLFV